MAIRTQENALLNLFDQLVPTQVKISTYVELFVTCVVEVKCLLAAIIATDSTLTTKEVDEFLLTLGSKRGGIAGLTQC